jgi:hypothetical protein
MRLSSRLNPTTLAAGFDDHHVWRGRLYLDKNIGIDRGDPDDLDTWLAGKKALNALSEERSAGENEYTSGIH